MTHPRTLAIFNVKGGEGKTTTAHALACGLAREGLEVLAVDLDSQANLTTIFDIREPELTLTDILDDKRLNLAHAIVETAYPGVKLVPASAALTGASFRLQQRIGGQGWLKGQIQHLPAGTCDVVVMDLAPGRDVLTINGVVAADEIVAPVEPSPLGLEGLAALIAAVEEAREGLNPDLKLAAVLPVKVDRRTVLTTDVLRMLREEMGETVSPVEVPFTVRVKEAAGHHCSIYEHSPTSPAAIAYGMFTRQLLGTPPTVDELRAIKSSVLPAKVPA
jgi:chromosome partitioning protein